LHFGKFKDSCISAVPTNYLRWVLASCERLDPWLRWRVQLELKARGERYLPAAVVLADLEELIAEAVDADGRIGHGPAGLLSDCVLTAFERLRERHGIGRETELVVPARGQWREDAELRAETR
jgi:hypothetical protein